jgi:uncharacterized membrane protein
MTLLIAGVVLWSVAHLFPALAPSARANLAGKLGAGPYKGLFALDIILALALIIFGWKAATPTAIYAPPLYGSPIPSALLFIAILLFVMARAPNNLKRYIRHPQLSGVFLWGISHLLTNGDSRSVVLFGGLAFWSLLEMIFVSKRDGEWQKPDSVPLLKDIITVVIAVVVFAGLLYFHAAMFGVAPIPA